MLPNGDEAVTIEHTSCSESHEAEVSALVDTDPKDAVPGRGGLGSSGRERVRGILRVLRGHALCPLVFGRHLVAAYQEFLG